MTTRAQHWTDTPKAAGARSRQIRNWANYQTRAGIWSATDSALEAAVDPGDLETGEVFPFGEAQTRAPLQLFLKDGSDPTNATRVHGRLSGTPGAWFELAANKGGPGFNDGVAAVVARNEKHTRFPKLWSTGSTVPRQASLHLITRPNKLHHVTRINSATAPQAFQHRLRLPVGWDLVKRPDGSMAARNGAGVARFEFPAPYAWDSADGGDVFGPGLESLHIAAEYTIDSLLEVGGHPVYLFTVALAGSVGSAVWPVNLDPTTTIGGAADPTALQDNFLHDNFPTNNYGANVFRLVGDISAQNVRQVVRIADIADIPAGTLTEVREYMWHEAHPSVSGTADTATVKTIAAADEDLVIGTANGAPQAGSCDWTYKASAATPWGGGVGSPSTDAAAVGSLVWGNTTAGGADPGWISYTWNTTTPWSDSRGGGRGNLAWIFQGGEAANKFALITSAEGGGAHEPYVEIDYTAATGGRSHSMASGIGRGIGRGLG